MHINSPSNGKQSRYKKEICYETLEEDALRKRMCLPIGILVQ